MEGVSPARPSRLRSRLSAGRRAGRGVGVGEPGPAGPRLAAPRGVWATETPPDGPGAAFAVGISAVRSAEESAGTVLLCSRPLESEAEQHTQS